VFLALKTPKQALREFEDTPFDSLSLISIRLCSSLLSQQQFSELHALLRSNIPRIWSDPAFISKAKVILKCDPMTSKGYQLTQELVLLEQEYN
jgi:hypothetical protein